MKKDTDDANRLFISLLQQHSSNIVEHCHYCCIKNLLMMMDFWSLMVDSKRKNNETVEVSWSPRYVAVMIVMIHEDN